MFQIVSGLLAAAVLALLPHASRADYPDKPVKIIIPFTTGGSTDVFAREFAHALSQVVAQPVVADNRGGADGAIGSQAAARSAPDGYTVLLGTNSTQVINALLTRDLPYDPVEDFAPVCSLGRTSNVMFIRSSLPHASVAEFIADAKAQPEKYTFAYVSAGTRLAGELFQLLTGVKLRAVQYRSSNTAMTDIAGGQVDMAFFDHVSITPLLQANKVRALAVTGEQRLQRLPAVPTLAEAGVPGYRLQTWWAVYLPAATPAAVLDRFTRAASTAVTSAAMVTARERLGVEEFLLCGSEFAAHQSREIVSYRNLVQQANLHPR